MKHLYNNEIVLQTDTRAFAEANYNRTILGMGDPGDVIYYKAPNDPSEHPMYVDSGGRNIPVSPQTLQPMTNSNGNIVDANGVLLPVDDVTGIRAHIDDVRIAVVSSDYAINDEDGNEILIAHDGKIIPTDSSGQPGTQLVNGEPWVVDEDGEPYAPLNRVFHMRSYAPPVRAENVPVSPGAEIIEDPYPEYFSIKDIVNYNRPARRGALVAWAAEDPEDSPVMAGLSNNDEGRFYTADKDSKYKYWVSPLRSEGIATLTGDNLAPLSNSWTVNALSPTYDTNFLSARFSSYSRTNPNYIQKDLTLNNEYGYEANFKVLAQGAAEIQVEFLQWTDTERTSASALKTQSLRKRVLSAGAETTISVNMLPNPKSRSQSLRIKIRRFNYVTNQTVSFYEMNLKRAVYPIEGVSPRAMYNQPINVNKIVIGVDYTVDERSGTGLSYSNKPSESSIRILTDRGDGVFVWQTVVNNPVIDDDGKIEYYFSGTGWGREESYDVSTKIMGVQYVVTAMKRKNVMVNVMEISARQTFDLTPYLMNYSTSSEISDDSFVLPFGTVNANSGSIALSNADGRFSPTNKFLLNRYRASSQDSMFTNVRNPMYQILNTPIGVAVETATFVPDSAETKIYDRMITANTMPETDPATDMVMTLNLQDDSALLSSTYPRSLFFHSPRMTVLQCLRMLLDSVGFTSVNFSDDEEHFSSTLQFFWTGSEDKSVWELIADICKATQTVAFFDEFNELNFKSLRGLYESALESEPYLVLTEKNIPGVLSNIKSMNVEDKVNVNKVTVGYSETSFKERTPSGEYPMEIIWEPDGAELLRSHYLKNNLDNKQPNQGGSKYLQFLGDATKTWPYEGMVQIEGEMISFRGKEYLYYNAAGNKKRKYIYDESERKELDGLNEELAGNLNVFTGRLKIKERAIENTVIRNHKEPVLNDFIRRYRSDAGTLISQYKAGIAIANSRLFVIRTSGTHKTAVKSVSSNSVGGRRPSHMGTLLRLNAGGSAGVCFGLKDPDDDGIYVELSSTESIEKSGRPYGELHVFVRKGGKNKHFGAGVEVPVSLFKDHVMDVSVKETGHKSVARSYMHMYEITLKYGDKGNDVKILQKALNEHNERLAVDGKFGSKTKAAVIRLQRRRNLTQDGIVSLEEWQRLELGDYSGNYLSVQVMIDGNYVETVSILKTELPSTWNGSRFGLFTRGKTSASFDYLYGIEGQEDVEINQSTFFDYVRGGYVSDQLDADWFYNIKGRFKSPPRTRKNNPLNNLYMEDFGAYAHEVRDYSVSFKDENPATSSFLYMSNYVNTHLISYRHSPFGAEFRLANKSRGVAVLNGEDSSMFGSEDSVEHKMMVYGATLQVDDSRLVTVEDKTSTAALGVNEMSIDSSLIQTKDAAHLLGSHIVEAMSRSVATLEGEVFGNATIRAGQIVSLYSPRLGYGDDDPNPSADNRFFVVGVDQENSGGQTTSVKLREVISRGGLRNLELKKVLNKNNNAMNMNPSMEEIDVSNGYWTVKGYGVAQFEPITVRPVFSWRGGSGGSAVLVGNDRTNYQSSYIKATPFPDGQGRFDHKLGDYFVAAVNVTAKTRSAVSLFVEGRPTTGSGRVLYESGRVLEKGETANIIIKGRYLEHGEYPEAQVALRMLNPDDMSKPANSNNVVFLNKFFYRSDQQEDSIYPMYGWPELRKD